MRKKPSNTQIKRLHKRNAGVCCVCKQRGIGTNLHHIDGDNSNTIDPNLAVLCVKDHDSHYRPHAYNQLNHLELGAETIKEYKSSWEAFTEEANKPKPQVLAVINVYGDFLSVHSVRLIFQWKNGKIEFERLYHLLTGPIEQWIDEIFSELDWLGKKLPLVLIDKPLEIDYCPCCNSSLSNTLDENMATKITAGDWNKVSICTVFINPDFPSLAITVFYKEQQLYSGHLHLCNGTYLHYHDNKIDERFHVNKRPSVRTQATRIVEKIFKTWEPSKVLIGTGDHDKPHLISKFDLPIVWEREARPTKKKIFKKKFVKQSPTS